MIEFDDDGFDWGDVVYGEERKRVKCVREYILGKTIGKGSVVFSFKTSLISSTHSIQRTVMHHTMAQDRMARLKTR
jgi:hypothetical protein